MKRTRPSSSNTTFVFTFSCFFRTFFAVANLLSYFIFDSFWKKHNSQRLNYKYCICYLTVTVLQSQRFCCPKRWNVKQLVPKCTEGWHCSCSMVHRHGKCNLSIQLHESLHLCWLPGKTHPQSNPPPPSRALYNMWTAPKLLLLLLLLKMKRLEWHYARTLQGHFT